MADKTIGGLDAVQEAAIGSLPGIADLYDDTLIPVEQQGEARHMTGAQWKKYAQAGVSKYVEDAQKAADDAQKAVASVGTAVENAAASATDAEAAREGAQEAREAIENMEVSADTLTTGQPASVIKITENGVVHLTFGLPKGAKGTKGDPGSSIQSIVRTDGTGAAGTTDTYTVTMTDGMTSTFQVYNGADGTGSGDMQKNIYDTQNRNTDIFQYVDEKMGDVPAPDDLVTVPGSGAINLPDTLGPGPYTIEFTDEDDPPLKAADVEYSGAESGLNAVNVQNAVDALSEKIPTSFVESFKGRTGAIVPTKGDYTAFMVGAVSEEAYLNYVNNPDRVVSVRAATKAGHLGMYFPIGAWHFVYSENSLRIISDGAGMILFPRNTAWPKNTDIAIISAFDFKLGRFAGKTPVAMYPSSIYVIQVDSNGNTMFIDAEIIINQISDNTWNGITVRFKQDLEIPGHWLYIYANTEFNVTLD